MTQTGFVLALRCKRCRRIARRRPLHGRRQVAALTSDDIIGPALQAEAIFHSTSMGPDPVPTLERLAALETSTLALMHGSSCHGDGGAQLHRLAAAYAERTGVVAS